MSRKLKMRIIIPDDKDEVLELTEEIWDGRDYIPDYFDDWVKDEGFICGVKDGEIVGLAKHTWHSDDILWLEGLRVNPDYHGEGYGRAMIEGQVEYINENLNFRVARFLTSGDNTPVKKVVEDIGFDLKQKYDYLRFDDEDLEEETPPSEQEVKRVQVEERSEEVIRKVFSSQELDANQGLYMEHWTAYPIDEELIRDRVKHGHCYSVRNENNGEIEALMFMQVHKEYESLSIAFACGTNEGMKELFKFSLRHCLQEEYERLRLKSASNKVIEAAQEVGFSYSDHHSCTLVYEYEKD